MSLLRVAAPLASLFFFSAFTVAQIHAPRCKSATLQWVCIGMSWFRQYILSRSSDLIHCVQAFNSLGQSPCDVTAFMMSTCWGGRQFFFFVCMSRPCGLIYLQGSTSIRCPRDTCTVALKEVLRTPTCASAVPSGIRSIVHVLHAKEKNGLRVAASCPLLNRWWLMYLSIAGQNGRPTVQRPCLPDREFLVASGHLLRSTLKLVRRYPNPVPPGTLVPHWALLDVRVRYPSLRSVALQSQHTLE
jgi:hypothetical protein